MEQEIRKILRCPICEKGRIADAPAGAALSQYRLFAMVGDEPFYPQLGVKLCSMAGGGVQKIYMVFFKRTVPAGQVRQ